MMKSYYCPQCDWILRFDSDVTDTDTWCDKCHEELKPCGNDYGKITYKAGIA